MKIKEITQYLETIASLSLQEDYDNSGLLIGEAHTEVKRVLISLDVTEEIVEEAIQRKCELIISHHPIIFSGLKSLTGKNCVQHTVIKAIRNNIALYALHTNLDNVQQGVNQRIGKKLGIIQTQILLPQVEKLLKLVVFVPTDHKEKVLDALFAAGVGHIGSYDECSFQVQGQGSFRGGKDTNPFVGNKGERHYEEEVRLEVVLPGYLKSKALKAMLQSHPYEEVAYDLYRLENKHPQLGSGMIGELLEKMSTEDFLRHIKKTFGGVVRHTKFVKDRVKKIAWCGGSGSFLLPQAKAAKADLFLTSDVKYHQFFDAEDQIIIADIGHYESEQFTIELIADKLKEKFATFIVLLTETNTNPINYL